MDDTLLLLACLALAGVAAGLANWRGAFLAIVPVGFIQDPLRKGVSGEPVFMVTLCAGVMAVALVGAVRQAGMPSLGPIAGGDRTTSAVLSLFVGLVLAQAIAAWLRYGSLAVAAIGLLSYLSPVPAIWLAYHYALGIAEIRRFLSLYVVGAAIVTAGIYLSVMGFTTVFLGQVGEGLVLYDPDFGALRLHSGLMRAPEVGAWHAGAGASLLIVLATAFRSKMIRALTPAALLYFVAAGLWTGRRKMLVTLVTFGVIYLFLLHFYRERTARRALLLVGATAVSLVFATLFVSPSSDEFRSFAGRGQTGFSDVGDRLGSVGLAAISWGYARGGFFGLGAGAGGQGTQHFAPGGEAIAGGSAEGGLGKVMVELGVPGFVLALLAAALVARNLARALALAAGSDHTLLRLSLGLVAFAAAHVPAFVGAAQIYGDPFVLVLLGCALGFVFAVPRIVRPRPSIGRRQRSPAPSPVRARAQRPWSSRAL